MCTISVISLFLSSAISVSLFLISWIVTIFLLSFYFQYVSHHIFNLLLFLFLSLSILSSYSSSTAVSLTHFLHSLLATSYFFLRNGACNCCNSFVFQIEIHKEKDNTGVTRYSRCNETRTRTHSVKLKYFFWN